VLALFRDGFFHQEDEENQEHRQGGGGPEYVEVGEGGSLGVGEVGAAEKAAERGSFVITHKCYRCVLEKPKAEQTKRHKLIT
jgi:hypothetical protein